MARPASRAKTRPMAASRPLALLISTVLTMVVAIGAMLFGVFLVAIATGALARLDSATSAIVAVQAALSIGYGALALIASIALWDGRAWAWPLAAAIHLIAFVGVLIGLSTGGFGAHIVADLTLSAGGLAALAPTSTREALWR